MKGPQARADVAQVVAGLIRVIRRTETGAARDWVTEIAPGLVLAAEPEDLAEALGALVENAARHARTRVLVRAQPSAEGTRISVIDDGPGIPPDRIATLIERGTRADLLGPGTGLGLAITHDIAEALGGQLTLHPAEPGLEAGLTLPAAP